MATPILLICSLPFECERLIEWLTGTTELMVGRKRAWSGDLERAPVIVLPGGMGKTNAAQAATALLEDVEPRGVIGFGVAGAYPRSGLRVGDIALASHAVYGDEGVQAPDAWLSTEDMGIPLLERRGIPVFNEIALDEALVARACAALKGAGFRVRVGPCVTVSTCSGTAARGGELAGRFGALCEGMEGAALAHVTALYDVPFLELRAVSNLVEDRDLSGWRLAEAAEAAQLAVRAVVTAWEPSIERT